MWAISTNATLLHNKQIHVDDLGNVRTITITPPSNAAAKCLPPTFGVPGCVLNDDATACVDDAPASCKYTPKVRKAPRWPRGWANFSLF